MRIPLILAAAAFALAGCASTSTPPSPPSSSVATPAPAVARLTAYEVCSDRMATLEAAIDVVALDAPTAAQIKDANTQLMIVSREAPAPFAGEYAAVAGVFTGSSIDVDAFKKAAQAIVDSCTTVLASASAEAAPAPAPNTIEEGTWTVGVDVKAGTYRTVDPVAGGCYWEITKAGTNGADIVENDNPTGGRPTVTLKKGQEFKNQGCGIFKKV